MDSETHRLDWNEFVAIVRTIRTSDPRFRWVPLHFGDDPDPDLSLAAFIEEQYRDAPAQSREKDGLENHLYEMVSDALTLNPAQELFDILAPHIADRRMLSVMLGRMGWTGGGWYTEQQASIALGVSRGQVRAMRKEIRAILSAGPVWTPALVNAVDIVESLAPLRQEEFHLACGMNAEEDNAISLWGFVQALDLFQIPHALTIVSWDHYQTVECAYPGADTVPAEIHERLRRGIEERRRTREQERRDHARFADPWAERLAARISKNQREDDALIWKMYCETDLAWLDDAFIPVRDEPLRFVSPRMIDHRPAPTATTESVPTGYTLIMPETPRLPGIHPGWDAQKSFATPVAEPETMSTDPGRPSHVDDIASWLAEPPSQHTAPIREPVALLSPVQTQLAAPNLPIATTEEDRAEHTDPAREINDDGLPETIEPERSEMEQVSEPESEPTPTLGASEPNSLYEHEPGLEPDVDDVQSHVPPTTSDHTKGTFRTLLSSVTERIQNLVRKEPADPALLDLRDYAPRYAVSIHTGTLSWESVARAERAGQRWTPVLDHHAGRCLGVVRTSRLHNKLERGSARIEPDDGKLHGIEVPRFIDRATLERELRTEICVFYQDGDDWGIIFARDVR